MINVNDGYYNYIKSGNSKNDLGDLKNSLDNDDLVIISKLYNLKNALSGDKINMSGVKRDIEELSTFNKVNNYSYLRNLMCPERARGSKLPSQIPVPSCSFQMKNSITLSTNASGNVAFFMNPFFLANDTVIGTESVIPSGEVTGSRWFSDFASSAWLNNLDSLSGTSVNNNWVSVNLGQTLPPVYDQYRVVSASLSVKYIGRLDAVQGEVGGAIFCEEVNTFGGMNSQDAVATPANTTTTRAKGLGKFAIFDYAEDAVYSKRNSTLDGIRLLYFPLDNTYEEFARVASGSDIEMDKDSTAATQEWIQVGKKQNGFNWFFWCSGGPVRSACFRLDICINFECLPSASFLNYIPVTISSCFLLPEEKKRAILYIQDHAIDKNSGSNEDVDVPDIYMRMIKKFKNGLPGFDRLRAMGILQASLPSLYSNYYYTGNAIASQMNIDA